MEWSNELTLEFIQLYELQPVLWDVKHKNHKSRNHLYDAWQSISRDISIEVDVETLKKKKESLMAQYRTLARKVRNSEITGSGTQDIYEPTWFAFNAIDRFIRAKDEKIPSFCSENSKDSNEIVIVEEEEICDVPNQITGENAASWKCLAPKRAKEIKKRDRGGGDIEASVTKHLKHASDMLTNIASRQTQPLQDSAALYAQLLATRLRRLPLRTQLILQNQIDNIVFQAELNEVESLTTTAPNPIQSSPSLTSSQSSVSPTYTYTNISQVPPHHIPLALNELVDGSLLNVFSNVDNILNN